MNKAFPSPLKTKKIAFVCHKLDGGIGRNIIRLSREFTALSIEVEIWSADAESAFPKELPRGVNFKVMSTSHAISGVIQVLKFIRAFNPDVVVTPSERFTRIVYRARKIMFNRPLNGKPLIVACVHSYYSMLYKNLSPKKELKRKRYIAKIYPKIEAVICVSNGAKGDYGQYAKVCVKNAKTIYNPVIDEGVQKNSLTQLPQGLDRNVPLIVNVGSIVASKNQQFLLQSFFKLREKMKCSLIFVGEGDCKGLREMLQGSEFKDDVFLVGHQTDPYTYIEAADLFAFTSQFEGFGNVVVESLYFGTPVVSTDSGGPKEILVDTCLGEIVDTQDPEIFAQAMQRWLNQPVDRKRLSQYVAQRYTVSVIAKEYLQLFESLLQSRVETHSKKANF